jgi:OPT family oligopeptide transporter
MKAFLNNQDILDNPDKHADLIHEMKLEAILVSENSPYAEVRAVVDNDDDPNTPSLTLRVWFIGTIFVIGGAFINQLFSIRQPAITVGANVAQLLSCEYTTFCRSDLTRLDPCGKALEKILPDKGFNLFGKRWSLNPGKFSKKEHMLITIMANVGFATPYSANVILSQYLPQYFNQKYAAEFAYQLLIGLSTNYIGYGLAGVTRRFLVYPSHCVWPTSLVTIALNKAFHSESNVSVLGPFGKTYNWSRMKTFVVCFIAMFW